MSRLWFVHRLDANVGDLLAGPWRYWDWGPHDVVDICDAAAIAAIGPDDGVVIGGGGLFMPWFDEHRARLLDRRPAAVAWWGVGERRVQDVAGGYLPEEAAGPGLAAADFSPAHLAGTRSPVAGLPHVPCASCKFVEAFVAERGWSEGSGVGIFEHVAVPVARRLDHPRLVNTRCSPLEALAFIARHRVLVTNSYHGMYWGSLLGRRVVCVPFSSGHYRFPWPVTYASPGGLEPLVAAALEADPAVDRRHLAAAVAANESFRGRVLAHLAAAGRPLA